MRKNKKRFIYMVLVGILISTLINLIFPYESPEHFVLYDMISAVFITIVIWEGSLRIDHWLNESIPWVSHTRKRFLIQFAITLLFSSASVYFPMLLFNNFVCTLPLPEKNYLLSISIVVGVMISFVILSIEVGSQFFKQWKNSLVEVEKYKTQSYQAQLQNLRDQVNPHFLFNNLSVLTSLVYKDQDKAADFINQLSKVYRYVLESKDMELVPLDREMDFINSYIFLLQIRFDKNFQLKMDRSQEPNNVFLPPMALQLLLENTIKHNEVSEEHPLIVHITIRKHELEVSNSIRERKVLEPSSGTGLNNLKKRFGFYTNREVKIVNDGLTFTVCIPLLPKFEEL